MKLNRPYNFRRPTDATPKTWFRITNVAADTTEVALYDEIGMWGVTASDFMAELMNITAKSMTLRINSPGGDVFDGLAILNCLRSHKAKVNVVVDGLAASAASFIAMAGDTVEMAPNSMMMIHEASGLCMGTAGDMRELADLLDKTSANIASIYASRSGRPPEEHRTAMRAETWYDDQQAVDAGLADAVIGSEAKATNKLPAVVKMTAPGQSTWDDIFKDVDLDAVAEALKGVTE
jgi:ATP-dependent protease ClpP protease subunit